MSEFLSQDDIDSLLQSGFGSADSTSVAESSADFLKNAAADLTDQMSVVLNTLTGREIFSAPGDQFLGDAEMVNTYLGSEGYLSVALPLTGGVQGTLYLTMLKNNAAVLYDLMIMGDGSAPYSEDVKDGITEILNQVAGNYATFLREKSGGSCSTGSTVLRDDEGLDILISDECILLDLSVSDIAPFQLIATFDVDLTHSLEKQYVKSSPSGGFSFDTDSLLSQDEIDSLTAATESLSSPSGHSAPAVASMPMAMPGFGSSFAPKGSVDMLLDIELDVSIELGRTNISIKRVLELAPGALVELDRLAGEPVDLMVNNKVVAKGEVVVVDESFGVRIISLVSPEERIRSLR